MLDLGKHSVLGVNVHAVDYDAAVGRIIEHARSRKPLAVSALAVHGVMTGVADPVHRRRLNGLDLVVPDGQPVRWALRWLYGLALPHRVYGPELALRTVQACADAELPIYLYGSKQSILEALAHSLGEKCPSLAIAGMEPSRFRCLRTEEREAVVDRIRASGARVVLLGLGCPRQEVWAFEYRDALEMPILAVGAAFDFHAGILKQAPRWMQDRGLEWLYRLMQEPGRLWKRYLLLNPLYVFHLCKQILGITRVVVDTPDGFEPIESFG